MIFLCLLFQKTYIRLWNQLKNQEISSLLKRKPISPPQSPPWAALVLALVLAHGWAADHTATKIVDHGPDSTRLVFVITGDGFRSQDQDDFNSATDSILSEFKNTEPFKTYWFFLNWYRVNAVSQDSGVTLPGQGITRNTAFETQVLGVDPIYMGYHFKNLDIVDNLVTKRDNLIIVANNGGSIGVARINHGISCQARGTGGLVALHETGHSFGGLADEMIGDNSGPSDFELPNASKWEDITHEKIKWKAWLEPDALLPTPEHESYFDKVGAFRGCDYSTTLFRPEYECLMNRVETKRFCRICTEEIVRKIHAHTRMLETPRGETQSVHYLDLPVQLSVSLVDLPGIAYQIRWMLDGVPIPGQDGTECVLYPTVLGFTNHRVTVEIQDTTHYLYNGDYDTRFVRSDSAGATRDSFEWLLEFGRTDSCFQPNIAIWYQNRNPYAQAGARAKDIYDVLGRRIRLSIPIGSRPGRNCAPVASVYIVSGHNASRQVFVK